MLDTKLGHHCGCHSKQHTNNKKKHTVTKVQNIIQGTLEEHKIGLVRAKEKRKGMVQIKDICRVPQYLPHDKGTAPQRFQIWSNLHKMLVHYDAKIYNSKLCQKNKTSKKYIKMCKKTNNI